MNAPCQHKIAYYIASQERANFPGTLSRKTFPESSAELQIPRLRGPGYGAPEDRWSGRRLERGLGIVLLHCGGNTCMTNLPGKTGPWRILAVLVQGCLAHLHL
jgi:hypothetical protein